MDHRTKTREELAKELQELRKELDSLKASRGKNITESKQAEERYRLLADHMSDHVWLMDMDLKVTYQSPSSEKLRGFTTQELRDMPLDKNLAPGSLKRALALFQEEAPRIFARQDYNPVFLIELEYYCKDGRTFWSENKFSIIRNKNGSPISYLGEGRDITDRKQIQESLRESELLYRNLFDKANEGLILLSLEGKLVEVNKSFAEMHGYTVEELKNIDIRDLDVLSERAFEGRAEVMQRIHAGEVVRFEVEHYHKDGHIITFSDTVSLINLDGQQFYLAFHQDITERKQSEKLLEMSNIKYQELVDSISDVFFSMDKNLRYTFWNKACVKLTGISSQDAIGKTLMEIFPDNEARQHVKDLCLQVIETNKSKQLTVNYPGNIYAIHEISVYPSVEGVSVFIKDITEQKHAEAKLREKDIEFRKLSANAPGMMYQFTRRADGSYYIPLTSDGINDIFGCSPDDVLDDFTPIGNVIYPDDLAGVINSIEHSAKHSTYFSSEFRVQIPGKEIQWIYSKSTPEKLPDGSITWYGFNTDISERKMVEVKLQKSENQFRTIFNNLQDAYFQADISGKLIMVSKSAVIMFGYASVEEMTGLNAEVLYAFSEERKKLIAELTDIRGVKDFVTQGKKKDGNTFWVSMNVQLLMNENGQMSGTAGIVRDITERKQKEMEILELNRNLELRVKQRTAELEAANKEMETFSYSVSHDLKTPLRHISSFISLFLENKSKELSEEDLGYLEIISSSASDMGKLIDGLLNFSRLNGIALQKTRIRSSEMVQGVIKFFDPEIQNRKITFHVETLPEVKGDEDLIRQVWINLISNAIKYTLKKPEAVIEIGSSSNDIEITFYIKDNGAGFKMKYAEKLFGVFQRLHKSSDFEGVGIGLANVKRILIRHGGHCRAEGEADKGATFYFSLPK